MLKKSDELVTVLSARNFFEFIDDSSIAHSSLAMGDRASRNIDVSRWSGVETFEEAVRLADKGWQEGLDKLNRIADVSFTRLSEIVSRPVVIYSDEPPGIDYDIVRVLNGEPEHWIYITEPQTKGRALGPIRIVANCTFPSNIAPEIIEAKGGAISALVMLLEFSGRPVELVCAYGICQYPDKREEYQGRRIEYYVTVKKPDQFLNPMILSFSLAHPSMSRRFLLSHMESLDSDILKDFAIPGHFGYPTEVSHVGDLYIFSGVGIPGMIDSWSNAEQVQQWLMWTLKEQGVVMKESFNDSPS